MRKITLIFTLLAIFLTNIDRAFAQEDQPFISNVGRAPFSLTAPGFACTKFLRSIRRLPVWHIAFLYNTFGNNYRCFNKLARSSKLVTVEINLINEPGHRNRRLGSYEFLHGISSPKKYQGLLLKEDPKLRKKFAKYVKPLKEKLKVLNPSVQCLINPGLESNVSDKAGQTLVKWSREEFPNCRIVWNPMLAATHSTGYAGADLLEGHGQNPPLKDACILNLDGTDISFPKRKSKNPEGNFIESGNSLQQLITTYSSRCEIVFLWTVEDNCNYDSRFIDPRKRNCSRAAPIFALTAKEAEIAMKRIKVYVPYEWTPEEDFSLNNCNSFKSAQDGNKRGFLLKQSHFSNRGGVIITPNEIKASSMQVFYKGKVIDSYRSDGKYLDGRPMWRSDKTPLSYPLHVVIKAKTNDGLVCYKIDNPKARND